MSTDGFQALSASHRAAARGVTLSPCHLVTLSLLAISLIAATKTTPPDDLVRDGNAAFERGDYPGAESLYTQAEERAADPGLVAFNKGDALYQQEKYREAEVHFRRALSDAAISPERRRRTLYNLGNSLLKQAGENDVARLRTAIRCYELCLDATPAGDAELRSDAAYNLELAKLLWAKARAKSPSAQKPINENDDDLREPPEPKKEPKDDGTGTAPEPKKGNEQRAKFEDAGKDDPKKGSPVETKEKKPGPSQVPVLKDEDPLQPMSEEAALASVRERGEQLRKERREMRRQAANPATPLANDW